MAIVPQRRLFGWQEIEDLGDLDRLRLVLDHLPDEQLMRLLEQGRGRGRDDYPVRAVWNSVLAGVVFQHPSIESLRRELLRNAQLRQMCGFDVLRGAGAVPPAWSYTRFLRKLLSCFDQLEAMFRQMVAELRQELPDFGRVLALDGKAISSHARGRKKDEKRPRKVDGRREADADWGVKTYRGQRDDGTLWQKTKAWFGFCLHLIVDADYELPLDFVVTRASPNEMKIAHQLVDRLEVQRPEILDRCEYLLADRGLDNGALIEKLWTGHEIKPVIDIRNLWTQGEDTRMLRKHPDVVYNYKGQVYCHCPQTGRQREMAFGGFESKRQSLKYRCPASRYGLRCLGWDWCKTRRGIRIPLKEDRRVFTPVARSSYAWKRLYAKRGAVERVNSRLDCSFGLEHHFVRGLDKMKLKCTLALSVMLAMALGRIKEKRREHLRSLVKAA
jgi:hypothetical protein